MTLALIAVQLLSNTACAFPATARTGHTATLLPNGKVLVAGGQNSSGVLSSAELYDPAAGSWSSADMMTTARNSHTATLLPNGKVLVAGGHNDSDYLSSAELYDPATGNWSSVGTMTAARHFHTATLLPDGKVLVAGGYNYSYLSSAELYDPATSSWSSAGTMASARTFHTATLLPDGKVLVAGGNSSIANLSSAELYDPATGSWSSAGTMATARILHSATLLPNGQVLVTGGSSGSAQLSSAELYDPATGNWSSTGTMAAARYCHTATLLPNGKVLVAGGRYINAYLSSAELYDPATDSWSGVGTMATARSYHDATLLPNGKVLVTGGANSSGYLSSAELYDLATGSWGNAGTMVTARAEHTATLLPNGKVLVAGGRNSGYLSSAELYDPATGSWSSAGTMTAARNFYTATLLPNGKVLVAGGHNGSGYLSSAELYDPATGSWSSAGTMTAARYIHTATLLPNGKVLVAGGANSSGYLSSAELYDPATGNWSSAGTMTAARYSHTATLLPNGKVLVAGGYNGSGHLSSAELYDPATGNWSSAGTMASVRAEHTATLLPNGKVLVAGGSNGGVLSSAELYDPATGSWSSAGTMTASRYFHTATLLPNGKVLVAGGSRGITYLSSAESYDPETGVWSSVGSMVADRFRHTATLLPNGKVLMAGGFNSSGGLSAAAERYSYDTIADVRRPVLNSVDLQLYYAQNPGYHFVGSHFRGDSEGGGGGANSSSSGVPILKLVRIDNGQTFFIGSHPQAYNFTPGKFGWSDTEFFSDSLYGLPIGQYQATLSANAVSSLAQVVTIAPEIISDSVPDFGGVSIGSADTFTVTFRNLGAAALTVSGATSDSADFSAETGIFPLTVAPGESNTIDLTFVPTAIGSLSGNITLHSNAAVNSALQIPLSGTGLSPTYALGVTVTGNGTVYYSPGTDMECTGGCSQNYDSGTVVTLTAISDLGYAFAGWSGVCSGTGSCTVTMNAAKSVIATFNPNGLNPNALISINQGAEVTSTTAVKLVLDYSLPATKKMRFCYNNSSWTAWEIYATTKTVLVPAGDGVKTVYVQFLGPDGQESQIYFDSIRLDTKAPVGTISLNSGAVATSSAILTLTLNASDLSGIAEMQFSRNGTTWSILEPYQTSRSYTLPATTLDGSKKLYVRFKDTVGNLSVAVSDAITLDRVAPVGSVFINGNSVTITRLTVPLNLNAPGAITMQLSLDGGNTWGNWEPYVTKKIVTLPSGDGIKTVQARFRDLAGNTSLAVNSTSMTTAPVPTSLSVPVSDPDGKYPISWGKVVTTGVTYTLEEATNVDFTTGRRVAYTGIATTVNIPLRTMGKTYFYRVRTNKSGWASSVWNTAGNGCKVGP